MDLYLGVVDLFGTILPGAIITFALDRLWNADEFLPDKWREGAEGIAVFLVASFIAGHIVFALGGMILDPIYDRTFKLWDKNTYCRVHVRALEVARVALGPFWMDGDNIFDWSTTFLQIGSGALTTAVERVEADSKFFRSLTVVLILAWPIYLFSLCPKFLSWTGAIAGLAPVTYLYLFIKNRGPSGKALQADKQRRLEEATADEQEKLDEALAMGDLDADAPPPDSMVSPFRAAIAVNRSVALRGPFAIEAKAQYEANLQLSSSSSKRSMTVCLIWADSVLATAFAFAFLAPKGTLPYIHGIGFVCGAALYVLLTLFSAWRYMERRLKRTELGYRSVVALFTLPPVFEGAKPAETPKAAL